MMKKVWILLLSLLFFSGCKKSVCNISWQDMQSTFKPSSSIKKGNSYNSLDKIQFFIDGSWSMWGYLQDNNRRIGSTAYSHSLNELDAMLIAQNNGKLNSYYKFGDFREHGIEKADIRDATQKVSFYNHNLTQIDEMFDYIARQTNLYKHAIIITDGDIVNPNGENFKVMIKGVNNLLAKGYNLELIGIKSSFNGKLSKTYEYVDYNGTRPFYLYVFSMGCYLGEEIVNQLTDLESIQYMKITDNCFDENLSEVSMIPSSKTQMNTKNPIKIRAKKPYFKFFWEKNSDERNEYGELITSITPHVKDLSQKSAIVLGDVILSKQGYSVSQGKMVNIEDDVKICDKVRTVRKKTIRFTLRFKKNFAQNDTILYKLSVLPSTTLTPLPEWVTKWSTSKASRKEDYGKTKNLKEFIKAVMYTKGKLAQQPIATMYLSIQEEEK